MTALAVEELPQDGILAQAAAAAVAMPTVLTASSPAGRTPSASTIHSCFIVAEQAQIGGAGPAEASGEEAPLSFDIPIRIASDLGLEVEPDECGLIVRRIFNPTGAIASWNIQMMDRCCRGDVSAYTRIVREGDVLASVNASASAVGMLAELARCERHGIVARIHVLRFDCY